MSTPAVDAPVRRTAARRKARELAKYLRGECPDYAYLKDLFRYLRAELDVEVTRTPKKLPYVPAEAELRVFPDRPHGRTRDRPRQVLVKQVTADPRAPRCRVP